MINYLFYGVLLFIVVAVTIGYAISAPRYSGELSSHFNGKKFFNPDGAKSSGFGTALKWMLHREQGEWKEDKEIPSGEKPPARVDTGARVTFVNHSTFLIQVAGLNILTDPIWSERSSPFSWAGPKRMRPPGIRFEDLPKIDVVVLSHNHYDHLDLATLKKLFEQYRPTIVTPLGVKALLDSKGIAGAVEADWWNEVPLEKGIHLEVVPAQHFSGRGLFDRDATLWGGYVIKTPAGNFYFAGDTGYNKKIFQEIGKRYAPVRVAMLPIGAYKPIWFMSPIHISPEEAVKAHLDLKAESSIAMHFGTFPLGDDGQTEPVKDLKIAMKTYQVPENQFLVLEEGTAQEIGKESMKAFSAQTTDRVLHSLR